jgi:hypothetical protein
VDDVGATRRSATQKAEALSQNKKSLLARLWDAITSPLPDGGIGDDGPPPDIDGRRDTDADYKRAVLTAKSQMSRNGMGTTSYQTVERGKTDN